MKSYSGHSGTTRAASGAVLEGDTHACAVRRWLDEFVIGLSFCPWAKPVDEAGGIRIVTSTAETCKGVLETLRAEAERLPRGAAEEGEATTTLIVCPGVGDFDDFEQFQIFFSEQLKEGNLFAQEFGLKVVAFHPGYDVYGMGVNAGDRVAVAGPDGEAVTGTVLDAAGGLHPDDGEELLDVRFDDGEEYLVRYSSMIGVIGGDGGTGDAANLVSRAPRPTFHLLRVEDLDRASTMGDMGSGPEVMAVLERNERRAAELGIEGVEEILRRCG